MKVKELYLNQIVIVFMHHLSHQIRHRILLLPPSVTFRLFLAACVREEPLQSRPS